MNGWKRLMNGIRERLVFGRNRPGLPSGVYVAESPVGDVFIGSSVDITRRLADHVAEGMIDEAGAQRAKRFRVPEM